MKRSAHEGGRRPPDDGFASAESNWGRDLPVAWVGRVVPNAPVWSCRRRNADNGFGALGITRPTFEPRDREVASPVRSLDQINADGLANAFTYFATLRS